MMEVMKSDIWNLHQDMKNDEEDMENSYNFMKNSEENRYEI